MTKSCIVLAVIFDVLAMYFQN